MFGDPMTYPAEINETTADDIIIDALCLYFGGDALDKQEPGDPRVIRALENMELLSYILWRRHIKGKGWEGLAKALDRRVAAIWDGAIDARRRGGKSWAVAG
jgi:hypothetical protein